MKKPSNDVPAFLKHDNCSTEAYLIGWDSEGFGIYACDGCKKCFLEDGKEISVQTALCFAKYRMPNFVGGGR